MFPRVFLVIHAIAAVATPRCRRSTTSQTLRRTSPTCHSRRQRIRVLRGLRRRLIRWIW